MDLLHFSCNVGGLGDYGPDDRPSHENQITRRNILDRMKHIETNYDRYPDIVALQETRTSKFKLAPRFGYPVATDDHVQVASTHGLSVQNARRGVATYADPLSTTVIPPLDTRAEIVCTVHDYMRSGTRGKKKARIACFNVYRL